MARLEAAALPETQASLAPRLLQQLPCAPKSMHISSPR